MKTFIIADTHFNHPNIIKYCSRPFINVEKMNETIINNWNKAIGKEDIIYHLGDFAMGSQQEIYELVGRLNGRIRLVMGNHDTLSYYKLYNCGFDRLYDKPIILENYWILSHKPPEFTSHTLPFVFCFGHVHNSDVYRTISPQGVCCCVERWQYQPVDFEDIKQMVEKELS